ncbi:hypothetical protein [Paenibacillus ginsengarvi]|uniref:Uncharacterized protein n=1 Tax=Paenibacillus ginsengarvi TaxID=400777 RepID=A0A3B0CLE3_9BACL|nr:hypothetical protein [Paenibacillus ginsengarvi]RKN85681.1 hypothetical protein D7M11_08370 [Paenibacillus ginsengarvi]
MADHTGAQAEQKRIPLRAGQTELVLGADKERHGLVSMRLPGTGFDIVREPYYALNLYRIMYDRRLQGIARYEPFTVRELSERGVTLHFTPTEVNPCEMEAVYEIKDDSTIDLTVTVEAFRPASKFEITVSSYFDFALEPYIVFPNWPGRTDSADMLLHKVEDHPLIKGHYVYFPRDNEAGHTRLDGRWLNEKTGLPIAPFVTGPFYGKPVALMSDGAVSIVQMADPDECAAIGTTYSSAEDADSIRRHNALYFTLFGADLRTGERRTARLRQHVLTGRPELTPVLEAYTDFNKN